MANGYKITPEITNFIIDKKKNKPTLSCRVISTLIEKKYQTPLSKSTINEIIKQAGLSLPIGRRSEKVRTAVQQSAPQPVSVVPVG
ncbi:MAG: helix-turn-helix domain-containing protein, partial [Candidatus Omnitrophota bacterium]|nr:helix-turn-helix domain-containing protein [Candidatus Omnitrophota bacterium]